MMYHLQKEKCPKPWDDSHPVPLCTFISFLLCVIFKPCVWLAFKLICISMGCYFWQSYRVAFINGNTIYFLGKEEKSNIIFQFVVKNHKNLNVMLNLKLIQVCPNIFVCIQQLLLSIVQMQRVHYFLCPWFLIRLAWRLELSPQLAKVSPKLPQ